MGVSSARLRAFPGLCSNPRGLSALFTCVGGGGNGAESPSGVVFSPQCGGNVQPGKTNGREYICHKPFPLFWLSGFVCIDASFVWKTAFAWFLTAVACHPALSLEAMMSHGLVARRQNLFPMKKTVPEQGSLPCHTHEAYMYGLRNDNDRDRVMAFLDPYEQAPKAGNRKGATWNV